jgi:hypothetical protein
MELHFEKGIALGDLSISVCQFRYHHGEMKADEDQK